jgi:hypothetical protein
MAWAAELAKKGMKVDLQKLVAPRGVQILPPSLGVERTIAWISHNRRMSKDYGRLCTTGEAYVYAAMIRLVVRRLARS